MTRPASARRPRTAPADVPLRPGPTAIETDADEVARCIAERDADLHAERMLLVREACIVVVLLVGVVLLRGLPA